MAISKREAGNLRPLSGKFEQSSGGGSRCTEIGREKPFEDCEIWESDLLPGRNLDSP